ncbi:metallophosphoesterase [Methanobrevibacter sp.]|uniref:metallophosphoesterase n=1 Tax=Methanobrevibacter sp. TaxID=66852 RepID=UPI003974ADA4
MVKIGIISDTHVSEKRGKLNEKIFEYFQDVDLIFHAGDITSPKVLDELSTIAPITAVKGNNDKFELKSTEFILINSFQIVLNHGTNFSANFDQLYEFGKKYNADILITGHTHKSHMEIIDDMLIINPGSARGTNASIAILNIDEKDKLITDIDIDFINL